MANTDNFILPYIYLHADEKLLPLTPDQYLSEVVMVKKSNILISNNVSLKVLSNNTYDSTLNLQSKHSDPRKFWEEYKYSNPSTIPLYYTETKQTLIYPDGIPHDYYERIFTTFYGYNEAGLFGLGNHEGDTEDFIIHYDLNNIPLRIFAGCHKDIDGEWRSYKDIEKINGHPVLYASKGNHGLYFEPKIYLRIFGVANDETQAGILWIPPKSINITDTNWPEFSGGWGADGANGPSRVFDPAIYWKSNTPLRRLFMTDKFKPFNPYV